MAPMEMPRPLEKSGSTRAYAWGMRKKRSPCVADEENWSRSVETQSRIATAPANCFRSAGEAGDEAPELLAGRQARRRVLAGVEVQPHAAQPVGRGPVVVEGDDPHPPAVEEVVERPLRERAGQPVLLGAGHARVEGQDAQHVGVDRPGVRRHVGRRVAQAERVGDRRLDAAGVDHVLGLDGGAVAGPELDRVRTEGDVGDLGPLPDGGPVRRRDREQVGVHVLPEEVDVRTHRGRERRELRGLGGPLRLARPVEDEGEVALHPARGADVAPHAVEGAEVGDLRDAVARRQDAKLERRLRHRRLAHGEARVDGLLEKQGAHAVAGEDGAQDGAGDPRAEDGDVEAVGPACPGRGGVVHVDRRLGHAARQASARTNTATRAADTPAAILRSQD